MLPLYIWTRQHGNSILKVRRFSWMLAWKRRMCVSRFTHFTLQEKSIMHPSDPLLGQYFSVSLTDTGMSLLDLFIYASEALKLQLKGQHHHWLSGTFLVPFSALFVKTVERERERDRRAGEDM